MQVVLAEQQGGMNRVNGQPQLPVLKASTGKKLTRTYPGCVASPARLEGYLFGLIGSLALKQRARPRALLLDHLTGA